MNILIRQHFGLPAEPWQGFHMPTADLDTITALVRAAAADRSMVQIVGPRGGGKTHMTLHALTGTGANVVRPRRLDRERVHINDIVLALIDQLSGGDRPRHTAEMRVGQACLLLSRQRRPVVLLVDDAHEVHYQTLKGVKRLREMGLGDRKAPMLGVVLCGQRDRCSSIPEVGLRTSTFTMGGLTTEEAELALQRVCGRVLEAGAIRRLAAAGPEGRNWLDMQDTVDLALTVAAARGEAKVSEASMAAALEPAKGPAAADEKPAGALNDALTRLEAAS